MTLIDSKNIPQIISDLESQISLPPGFITLLANEDDWSFVIKLHALMEAAITHLLSETLATSTKGYAEDTFQESSLSRIFAWMEMSNKRTGKIAIAEALGLILEWQRKFVAKLSEIRNHVVHDVKNVSFSFPEYVKTLDSNQRQNLIDAFDYGVGTNDMIKSILKVDQPGSEFVLTNTKLAIWGSALLCLSEIAYCILAFKSQKRTIVMNEEMSKTLQQFLDAMKPFIQQKGAS